MADITHLSDADKQIIKRSSNSLFQRLIEKEHTTNGEADQAKITEIALVAARYTAFYDRSFTDAFYSDLVDILQA